jgi:hypothetical protein
MKPRRPKDAEVLLLRYWHEYASRHGEWPRPKQAADVLGVDNVEVGRMVHRLSLLGAFRRLSSEHGDYVMTARGRAWADTPVDGEENSAADSIRPCPLCGARRPLSKSNSNLTDNR